MRPGLEGEDGETLRFIPECHGLRQKEHVGSLPGGPDKWGLCHLGSCQGSRLPGVSRFLGCHAGPVGLGMSPPQSSDEKRDSEGEEVSARSPLLRLPCSLFAASPQRPASLLQCPHSAKRGHGEVHIWTHSPTHISNTSTSLKPSPFLALVPACLCPANPFVFPCFCRSLSLSHNWAALAS